LIISLLSYQKRGSDQKKIWQFKTPTGTRRNFLVHCDAPEELDWLIAAVNWIFTEAPSSDLEYAFVQFFDDNGSQWAVERRPGGRRISRDRKEVLGDEKSKMTAIAAALETPADNIRNLFDVRFDALGARVNPIDFRKAPNPMLTTVQDNIKKSAAVFSEILGTDEIAYADNLHPVIKKLEIYYYGWLELTKERETILSQTAEPRAADSQNAILLKQEVDLICRIAEIAEPLLDPQSSPTVIKEKLARVEADLKQCRLKYNIPNLPPIDKNIPWEKLLHNLTRLRTYEALVANTNRVYELIKTNVIPVVKERRETIESLLQNDNQITSELESCLSTITMAVMKIETERQAKDQDKNWIQQLRDKITQQDKDTGSSLVESSGLLEKSRMSVDYTLARLGELHARHQTLPDLEHEAVGEVHAMHEKYVAELHKYQKLWQSNATEFELPEAINIKTLLDLINNFGHYSSLWKLKQDLNNQIIDYKRRLESLESLVVEWRKASGSQKDIPLDTSSILLSEIRSILHVREAKEKQLARVVTTQETQVTHIRIIQHLERRMAELHKYWDETLVKNKLAKVDIAHPSLPKLFSHAHNILALSSLLPNEETPALENIFSEQTLAAPLAVFRIQKAILTSKERLLIANAIQSAPDLGLALIATSDEGLVEVLKNVDIVTSQSMQKAQPQPQTTNAQQNQLLSTRAQKALAIFQNAKISAKDF
jgi:hypothetical protein